MHLASSTYLLLSQGLEEWEKEEQEQEEQEQIEGEEEQGEKEEEQEEDYPSAHIPYTHTHTKKWFGLEKYLPRSSTRARNVYLDLDRRFPQYMDRQVGLARGTYSYNKETELEIEMRWIGPKSAGGGGYEWPLKARDWLFDPHQGRLQLALQPILNGGDYCFVNCDAYIVSYY